MIVDVDIDVSDFSTKDIFAELEYRVSRGRLEVEELTSFLEEIAERRVILLPKSASILDMQKIDFFCNHFGEMNLQGVESLFNQKKNK